MTKYQHLIFGGLVFAAAIAVIIWILKQSNNAANIVASAASQVPTSPDEQGNVEPLNGLAPNNEEVTTAQTNLTYNVPQPGVVPPISTNQDYVTSGQALVAASDSAQDVISNLLAVNLPPSDYVN